jgi:lipopolysaccharide assembly outer membrane protein LptD (OstA)
VEVAVKLFALIFVLACSLAVSQDAVPARLHTVAVGSDHAVHFAADSIVKEDGPTRYDSLVHLKGNVEIRTCCVQRATSSNKKAPRAYLVMHADEADYNGETDQIEARGTVRVSFQEVK